jgi:hypothetical protein
MTAPVFVRLRPSLHKVDLVTLDKVLTKALEDIRKAHKAGFTVTVVSPDARTINGRKRIAEALRHAGLEPEIVSLLGWGTTYPGAEPPTAPAALAEASTAADEATDDPPTLTDDPSE